VPSKCQSAGRSRRGISSGCPGQPASRFPLSSGRRPPGSDRGRSRSACHRGAAPTACTSRRSTCPAPSSCPGPRRTAGARRGSPRRRPSFCDPPCAARGGCWRQGGAGSRPLLAAKPLLGGEPRCPTRIEREEGRLVELEERLVGSQGRASTACVRGVRNRLFRPWVSAEAPCSVPCSGRSGHRFRAFAPADPRGVRYRLGVHAEAPCSFRPMFGPIRCEGPGSALALWDAGPGPPVKWTRAHQPACKSTFKFRVARPHTGTRLSRVSRVSLDPSHRRPDQPALPVGEARTCESAGMRVGSRHGPRATPCRMLGRRNRIGRNPSRRLGEARACAQTCVARSKSLSPSRVA
jgi:hypothetical protein